MAVALRPVFKCVGSVDKCEAARKVIKSRIDDNIFEQAKIFKDIEKLRAKASKSK